MKKMIYLIITLIVLLITSACYLSRRGYTEEKEVIGDVKEYSYLTKKGEITEEYNVSSKDFVSYYSMGALPLEDTVLFNNNIIYYDSIGNPMFYTLIKTNIGDIKRPVWFDSGAIFESIDIESNSSLFNVGNHIELMNNNDSSKITIGWFDYRIVINAHIYYVEEGSLIRTTINSNEKTILINSGCSNVKYKEGYLYYLQKKSNEKSSLLYKIGLDGNYNEQVSDLECFDFCLTNNGILFFTESDGAISLTSLNNSSNNEITKIYEFKKEQYYNYQLIGEIDDNIYLSKVNSRTIKDSGKIKIMTIKNGNLEMIHESDQEANTRYYHPFIQDKYIYYNAEGIYQYDPQENKCNMIANFIASISIIKAE